MKYRYNSIENFGDLLRFEEVYSPDTTGITPELEVRRGFNGQEYDRTYKVEIKTTEDMVLLLDYLSTDKKGWDYEPRLEIHIGNCSINFQARGNWGHDLKIGDVLIVDRTVRDFIRSKALALYTPDMIQRRENYLEAKIERLQKENQEKEKQLQEIKKILEKKTD